ncbi:hypothetical protein [Streptomyces sp. WAC08241]|uniref:hypothetical protein n=1 Tax=Streptomyces sp. WAC08241 TaxID=2487421 RepID=UPI000F7A7DEF|nr:hypothetical protein [Streptomyces sp. WAC08241]RSS35231.1 hypothetical protein EF906_27935 [Streptomyces sp. WAC08241]
MPSAHAPVPHDGPPGHHGGSVIHLADRLLRRKRPTPAPGVQHTPAVSGGPALELALTVEAAFGLTDRSLTDRETAAVYDTTMETVLLLVDGARHQGVVDDEQWQTLTGMLTQMRNAPELL